ncbi:hypothetical protein PR048_013417, partial [Dryococelus australis]
MRVIELSLSTARMEGRGKLETLRKPTDQRHHPTRFPHARIKEWPSRGLNPVRLGGRLVCLLFSHHGPITKEFNKVRTTDRCHWSEESLQKAIKAVKEDKLPIKTAAVRFDVPRTTLCCHLTEIVSRPGLKCLGRNTVLGNYEWSLVEHLHNLKNWDLKHRTNNEEPALLVLDGHGSHWKSSKTLEYAVKYKTEMVCLPPHTTHWTQQLKKFFKRKLQKVYEKDSEPQGICPFDENVFHEESFAPCEITSEPQTNEHVDKLGNTAAHEDMDAQDDPDYPKTSQSHSENEEADTIGIGNENIMQEESKCGKCEGDFFDDEGETWIQCRGCDIWFHEICAG